MCERESLREREKRESGRLADDGCQAAGFDMKENHVELSGRVLAVSPPATATAADRDAAQIIRDMRLRPGAGVPDVLVADRDAKFTREAFRAFAKCIGTGSDGLEPHRHFGVPQEYGLNTIRDAKVERADGFIYDTLGAWDKQSPFAEFAINNSASTLGWEEDTTPFFIVAGAACAADALDQIDGARAAGDESCWRQAAGKAKLLDAPSGRVDTVFTVGDCVLLRTQ